MVAIGSGSPVVLVPGGAGYGATWLPFLPELKGHQLLVMDRPGGGLSDGIDHRSLSLRRIAVTSMAALFNYFDLDRAPQIANSMGGLWSLRFVLDQPERTSAVALLGSPALFPGMTIPFPMRMMAIPVVGPRLVESFIQADSPEDTRENLEFFDHPTSTAEGIPEPIAEAWYRMEQIPHFERSFATLLQQAVRLRGSGCVPEAAFTSDELGNVKPPVLLGWGSDDPFATPETGRRGAEGFPDATFHEVGTGHLPWLDEPKRCGQLVRKFIDRHR